MKRAVLLISHGSREARAKKEIHLLTRSLKAKSSIPIFQYAFLEINRPSISAGLKRCVEQGAGEIIILLNFLNNGRHALRDIPRIVNSFHKKYPAVKIRTTAPVGQHPEIKKLFLDILHKTR